MYATPPSRKRPAAAARRRKSRHRPICTRGECVFGTADRTRTPQTTKRNDRPKNTGGPIADIPPMRATAAVMMLIYASSIRRLCVSRCCRQTSAVVTSVPNTSMSKAGIARNTSGSTPVGDPPRRAVAIAVAVPTAIIAAASAAPAIPRRRCTATRRVATSAVCVMNRITQAVNSAPWRWISPVNGPPLTVACGPPEKKRK